MKKIILLTIFFLLPLFLTGCGEDEPESMTFIDDLIRPTREFSINEHLEFNVKFVNTSEDPEIQKTLNDFGLGVGTQVFGKAKDTNNKWTDDIITGTAQEMRANNSDLTEILKDLDPIEIKMEYVRQNNSIIAVKVEFPGDDIFDNVSRILMGGTYIRK